MDLTSCSLIGEGRHRRCYLHPDNDHRCIKIVYSMASGGDKELKRELKYYKHLSDRGINWDVLPRYYGEVETNLGTGYIYDLVRDFEGDIAKSLAYYLAESQKTGDFAWLPPLLQTFKRSLAREHIVTMSLKPDNILVQRLSTTKSRLVIVDNIGEASFIPVASYIRYFYDKKLTRIWQRFYRLLESYGYHLP